MKAVVLLRDAEFLLAVPDVGEHEQPVLRSLLGVATDRGELPLELGGGQDVLSGEHKTTQREDRLPKPVDGCVRAVLSSRPGGGVTTENVSHATLPYLPPPPRYLEPDQGRGGRSHVLVWRPGTPHEHHFVFFDQIQIGRDDEGATLAPGMLLIADPTISRRHCIVRLEADGRCFARDVSRNGTRLDGRRLVPNLEVEIRPGQTLSVSANAQFVLQGTRPETIMPEVRVAGSTIGVSDTSIATVLVGDIRNYTTLVRQAPSRELQQSVNRVFEMLTAAVIEHGGTVKEYQGDAILAFWEGSISGTQAVAACQAALALDCLARAIASDQSVWLLTDFPLVMDWALATGPVHLDSFGGSQPTGLSLIGEPVVLAFRLEKFATDATGPILACAATREMADSRLRFRDLGMMHAKGFDQPDRVFALEGEH
jgi:class 3 adenylate cyclase